MQPHLFPYSPERDVYRLLQVEPSADPGEITAAVRRLARTFHPDRNASPRATQEMQVVNAVRNLLVDPQARAVYDRARHRFLAQNAARRARLGATPQLARPLPAPRGPYPLASQVAMTRQWLIAAFRAILQAFGPPRCSVCNALPDIDHQYCAACGAPLRRPQPLPFR